MRQRGRRKPEEPYPYGWSWNELDARKIEHPTADRRLVASAERRDVGGRADGGSRTGLAADFIRAGHMFVEDVLDDRRVASVAGLPVARVPAYSAAGSIKKYETLVALLLDALALLQSAPRGRACGIGCTYGFVYCKSQPRLRCDTCDNVDDATAEESPAVPTYRESDNTSSNCGVSFASYGCLRYGTTSQDDKVGADSERKAWRSHRSRFDSTLGYPERGSLQRNVQTR
mmetsp:Transcript_10497/g.31648  ORF Transcript_10497/g.31648 Transcript_10497/m.31648 type:complete len:230 (+) Transcript_10497:2153-2842(+)